MCSGMPLLRSWIESTSSAAGHRPQERLGEPERSGPVEPRQADLLGEPLLQQADSPGRQRRARHELVAAVGRDDHARGAPDERREALEHGEAELVRPVEVLDAQQHRVIREQRQHRLGEVGDQQAVPAGVVARRVAPVEPFGDGGGRGAAGRAGAARGRGRRARRRGTPHPAATPGWSGPARRRAARAPRRGCGSCRCRPRRRPARTAPRRRGTRPTAVRRAPARRRGRPAPRRRGWS